MADHLATHEQVEKVNEDIQTTKQEDITPCKEVGEKDENEQPKAENSTGLEIPITKFEETADDKQTEPLVVVEIEKVDDASVSDVHLESGSKGVEIAVPGPEESSFPDSAGEAVERQPEVKPAIESVKGELEERPAVENEPEQPAIEAVEKQQEEKPKTETVEPNSLSEAVGQPVEGLEVSPVKDSKPEIIKHPEETSEVECKTMEKPEFVNEVEDKPQQELQVIEEVAGKIEEIKTEENAEGEVLKNEGKITDAYEGGVSLNEDKISAGQEPVSVESFVATNEETQADLKEAGEDPILSNAVEKNVADDTDKEKSVVDVVEGLLKDESVATGKDEEETKEMNVKIEQESEEKDANLEEPNPNETNKTEDGSGSNAVVEVAEKSFGGEQGSRDAEVIEENLKEDISSSVETNKDKDISCSVETNKDKDISSSVETNKDKDIEGKVNEANAMSTADHEPTGKPKDSQLEVKAEETEKFDANKLESTKEAIDEKKSEPPTLESSKDGDDTKTSGDLTMQEASVRTAQKQSNNLISKMKQSIVKVKKAIIGKSPSSKTLSTEAKGDGKVR